MGDSTTNQLVIHSDFQGFVIFMSLFQEAVVHIVPEVSGTDFLFQPFFNGVYSLKLTVRT